MSVSLNIIIELNALSLLAQRVATIKLNFLNLSLLVEFFLSNQIKLSFFYKKLIKMLRIVVLN
jgi:hypothetical protein